MEKYVFSGSLTDEMHDMLLNMPNFFVKTRKINIIIKNKEPLKAKSPTAKKRKHPQRVLPL